MKKMNIFYSLTGNNEKLARYLAGMLSADIHEIREKRKRRKIEQYLTGLDDEALEKTVVFRDMALTGMIYKS